MEILALGPVLLSASLLAFMQMTPLDFVSSLQAGLQDYLAITHRESVWQNVQPLLAYMETQ